MFFATCRKLRLASNDPSVKSVSLHHHHEDLQVQADGSLVAGSAVVMFVLAAD